MEKTYKILKILIFVLAFAVVLAGAFSLYNRMSAGAGQDIPTVRPAEAGDNAAADFTVYDIDGNACKLSDFQGKPVILNFWASWCGYCKEEMPEFEKAYGTYGEEIHFMMVDIIDGSQETWDSGAEFIEKQGYTFPVYFDADLDAAMQYRVYGLPVTYFIDAAGNLVTYVSGAVSAERLQRGIDLLLGN